VYGAYLLACYNEDTEDYEAICKIGTGFSEQQVCWANVFACARCCRSPACVCVCVCVCVSVCVCVCVWFRVLKAEWGNSSKNSTSSSRTTCLTNPSPTTSMTTPPASCRTCGSMSSR